MIFSRNIDVVARAEKFSSSSERRLLRSAADNGSSVGGGICQVSTTAFRAAFWGGYPIVERWYHQHRVGYYELMGAGLSMGW